MRTHLRVALAALLLAAPGCDAAKAAPQLAHVDTWGGPVMAHPRIFTITFSEDGDGAALTQHAAWMMASTWLTTVGAEYGVGSGSVLGSHERTDAAPDVTTQLEIEQWLASALDDGTLTAPPDGDFSSVLYVVHFPVGVVVMTSTGMSCVDFDAFHFTMRHGGDEIVYAVEVGCPATSSTTLPQFLRRERATSHELIEAATDAFPSTHPGFRLRDPNAVWAALGLEIGDLCELPGAEAIVTDGAFGAQRIWSDAAASTLDRDPCIPAPEGVYFNVAVAPETRIRMQPGEQRALVVTGWATGPVADWHLATAPIGSSIVTVQLDATTLGPGRSTTLHVTVPALATPGTSARVVVVSFHDENDARFYPVFVTIDPPCSAHTNCEECGHRGCGWCAATGRCEVAGALGSAESTCAGSDWAPWPGACSGFCSPHASCTDCAAQTGCGWCEGVGCLPAATDYDGSADGTCRGLAWSFLPSYCP